VEKTAMSYLARAGVEEMTTQNSQEDLRTRLCRALNIFPNELKDKLPNSVGFSQMQELEAVVISEVYKEVCAVLDRLEKEKHHPIGLAGSNLYMKGVVSISAIEAEKSKYAKK